MAGLIVPDSAERPAYRGLPSIFEYTNTDGALIRTNCGQAAAATFLTHYGKMLPDTERARQVMAAIERDYPPDNFGGYLGTSRRRVIQICHAYGVEVRSIAGEERLLASLKAERPVIVMLGVSAGSLINRFDLPGGHWMVAFGFSRDFVYLTNYGRMPWAEFRTGWTGWIPRLIQMQGRGLVHSPPT
jgi:hypothetical protein